MSGHLVLIDHLSTVQNLDLTASKITPNLIILSFITGPENYNGRNESQRGIKVHQENRSHTRYFKRGNAILGISEMGAREMKGKHTWRLTR